VDTQAHVVSREEQVERPVERDADLPAQSGHLVEVDRAPEEPGEDAGDAEAEDLRDGRAVAERAHLAERVEREGLLGRAPQRGHDVFSEAPRLAGRVLGSRRARLPGLRVKDPRAVAASAMR